MSNRTRLSPLLACLALAVPLASQAASSIAGAFECSYPDKALAVYLAEHDCIKGNAVALDGDTLLLTPLPPEPQGKSPPDEETEHPPDKEIFGANDLDPLAISPESIKVRLWGVDAPEMDAPDGSGWGARKTMDSLLVWQPVTCTVVNTDRHGRVVATCVNDPNGDLGRMLIWAGWAVEYRKSTRPPPAGLEETVESYAEAESQAEHNRRGRWKWIFGK